MRLMINENAYGWVMTGLLGAYARWFIGFSYNSNLPKQNEKRHTGNPQ